MEVHPTATPSSCPAPPDQPVDQPTSTSFPPPPDSSQGHPVSTPFVESNIGTIKSACESSLREYITLQKGGRYDDPAIQNQLRAQYGFVMSDLQTLRNEVVALVKAAESHRWRRWLLGGLVPSASFIPIVRKIFRRSPQDRESNDTEHAFTRSRSLISRILDTVRGGGRFASMAFLVLAVLYVFQNEVSLRVARTVSKRLRRLVNKIERGESEVVDKDLDTFKGWRWRVLLM